MNNTVKSTALNYGLYLGGFFALASVIVYAVNLDLFTEWWLGILFFVVAIVFGVLASLKARKLLGGFISFKDAFVSYFITLALGTLIGTIVGIVIFTFIDPEAAEYLNEQILVLTKQTMERFGAPQEAIVEAIEKAREKDNFSVGAQLQSWVIRLIFYIIFGLIIALIVKKKDPELEQ